MGAGQSKSQQPSSPLPSPPPHVDEVTSASSPSSMTQHQEGNAAATTGEGGGGGGCPMRNADGSYRSMPGFASLLGKLGGGSQHPPIPSTSTSATGAATSNESSAPTATATAVKYDVYSRPITSIDPNNNMPSSTDTRNILPSSSQTVPLDTTRIASTIPRGGGKEGETWVYPSPQMFYNALVRKGKLANATTAGAGVAGGAGGGGTEGINSEETTTTTVTTKEEDMASVVAMHNCMNEATWRRVLQWEEVLHPTSSEPPSSASSEPPSPPATAVVGPALSRFEGRPTDLSPKAFIKHYILGHPLPFDRHDWTITRTNLDGSTQDVRYVIDYYHDDASASDDVGSGYPRLDGDVGPNGQVQSLLVDVRPAADSVHEIWGRLISMPLARRGCGSIVECVLAGGGDCTSKDDVGNATKKSEFEPLPLYPSESLSRGLEESKQVWKSIQLDALMKKGVGAMDDKMQQHSSSTLEQEPQSSFAVAEKVASAAVEQLPKITPSDATNYASTYSQILSTCQESKKALQQCQSEEECEHAMVGMTVCAGQFMCPLQHSSLLDSLKLSTTTTTTTATTSASSKDAEEAAEVRISTALDILSECVANYDARASVAKRAYPELFDKVSKGQK
ncbi:hypothetical protein ACHAXH_006899 [Discostella pseudostelligera]